MPSGPEWIIVLVVVLVIFGGSQLPKLAKNLGKAQKEFKDGLAEGQAADKKEADSAAVAAAAAADAAAAATAAAQAAAAAAARANAAAQAPVTPTSPAEPISD
jgi:sec-independent protein translocase protein TatA